MDRAIYTAMGAASAAMDRQSVTAGNLANSSTPGFRAQLSATRAVPVTGHGVLTRTLATATTPWHASQQGPVQQTGRELDVVLPAEGWLAVQRADGSEAYARNGSIEVDSEGQLRIAGLALLGDGGPLTVPPQATLTVAADGTVTARGAGDQANVLTPAGRLKLVSAPINSLRRSDDGLFLADSGELPADAALRLTSGALEGSNVSPAQAMVEMIATARGFDMNMKLIGSVDENARAANQLLSAG